MRINLLTLTICACLALAAADVSHLTSSSYLPPHKPEQVEQMSIEQHELRELPEQVDYMRENEHGAMEMALSSQLTPPAMPEAEQMPATRYLPPAQSAMPEMEQMPATRYLPPAMPEAEQMPAMPETRYLPPMEPASQQRVEPEPVAMTQPEMMSEPAMDMTPVEPQAAPEMRYLPPAQQADQQQLTYQQYQEQLQQEQQMPYILDVQQPMAPSDADSLPLEPEPAHELLDDGYHYKQAAEEQRLRH